MKKHIEEKFQLDQLDPKKRREMDEDPVFKSFWTVCLEKSPKRERKQLTSFFSRYAEWTWETAKRFDEFHSFLKDVPLVVALRHWIEGAIQNPSMGEQAVSELKKLLEYDLIPLSSSKGELLSLGDVRFLGHQDIIENIRCVEAWTHLEKERLVNYYVRFSCDLARYTFDYVLPGFDPDRKIGEIKSIPYEVFYTFIQFLSARDALISKFLYFGAPSIDEVLSLKVKAVDKKKHSIQFDEKGIVFPKHLIQDLFQHAKENANPKGLVFSNLRGEAVERAHLNQSFARASDKMPKSVKITPASLLRFAGESIKPESS
jgi:hypothetical protein